MKRKIIYLLVAVLCLAALLPSCDQGNSATTACEAHVDADTNLFCDNCNTPVHTVVNNVPTEEEEIPTIFAEIPADSKISTLFNTSFKSENNIIPENVVEADKWFEDGDLSHGASTIAENIFLISRTTRNDEDPSNVYYTSTVMLYNANIAKTVFNRSVTYNQDATPVTSYSVNMINANGQPCAFRVTTTTLNTETSETLNTYSFYTLDGTSIEVDLNKANTSSYQLSGGQTALEINGTIYVIENNKIKHTFSADTFVDRPMFSYINAEKKLGYLLSNNNKSGVLIYDLNKWVECVWSYEIPSCYGYDVFFLANGNLLIQTENVVPDGSVNYDYISGGSKIDLDYFVVDITAKTTTEIEFGYYINNVTVADSKTDASAVKNWITVNDIANKNIASDTMILATADDLTIIGEKSDALPSVLVENIELVANNTFLATLYYGEGTSVRKLYDANGTEIATLPNHAEVTSSFIVINNTVYDFKMKPIYSLTETQVFTACFDTYIIIYDEGNVQENIPDEYFYLSATGATPVRITSTDITYDTDGTTELKKVTAYISEYSGDYFIVATNTVDYVDNSNNSTIYKLYNENGTLVFTSSKGFDRILEGDGVFTIVLSNGDVVVAK